MPSSTAHSQTPRYDRVTHLIPQDATRAELDEVFEQVEAWKQTVTYSADHALDTTQENHLLYIWGVERIVQPPAESTAAARAAFIDFARTKYGRVPTIVWEDFNSESENPNPVTVEVGLHDIGGGMWMMANEMRGYCLHAAELGTAAQSLDFSGWAAADIKVLVRLNYGYAPDGTIPDPHDSAETLQFIEACIATMQNSTGVWGWIIGNEPRNPQEYPNGIKISVEQYAAVYNAIYRGKSADDRLAPAAIDPYYGIDGINPLRWMRDMLAQIDDAEFFTIHAKTQGSLPHQISSETTFAHPPLIGHRLHFRAYRDVLDYVPQRFATLPVIITEANPQRYGEGYPWDLFGWGPMNGAEWVQAAIEEIEAWNLQAKQQIHGIIFYRWAYDVWALEKREETLLQIRAFTT